jgi:hypothetical protein
MSYRSKQSRKDNPRWVISNPGVLIGNATETSRVPSSASPLLTTVVTTWDRPSDGDDPVRIGGRVRSLGGFVLSWLIGLPRRAGSRLYAKNDEEAGWRGWQVTETFGGLGRSYRDARFDALRLDPTLRRVVPDEDPSQPDSPCGGCR